MTNADLIVTCITIWGQVGAGTGQRRDEGSTEPQSGLAEHRRDFYTGSTNQHARANADAQATNAHAEASASGRYLDQRQRVNGGGEFLDIHGDCFQPLTIIAAQLQRQDHCKRQRRLSVQRLCGGGVPPFAAVRQHKYHGEGVFHWERNHRG